MASLKVTYTLDQETVRWIDDAAARLGIPKSEVVREAIAEFHDRLGLLSTREKTALLKTFDDVVPQIAARPLEEVDRELRELRQDRRSGGRRHRTE